MSGVSSSDVSNQPLDPHGARANQPTPELISAELIIAAGQLVRRITKEAFHGTSATAWRALSVVDQHGSISVGEFARNYGSSQPAATRLLTKLEGAGLVRREAVAGDARQVRISMTPAGAEHLRRERGLAAQYLAGRMGDLTDGDRDALLRTAELLRTALAAAPDDEANGGRAASTGKTRG